MNRQTSRRNSVDACEVDAASNTELIPLEDDRPSKEIVARASAAWPFLKVDVEPFVARVLTLLDSTAPTEEAPRGIRIGDLFLAYACSLGDPAALKAFANECEGELRAVASKLRISNSDIDDIRQRLWNKLFLTSDGRRPMILEYRGTGQLRHWFRVLAARSAIDDLRKSKRSETVRMATGDAELLRVATSVDPELDNIRRRFKNAFRAAFEIAVQMLEPEERNFLRCYYALSMSTDQIAKAFGIHKATAARRLGKSRNKLLAHTRAQLKNDLGANSGELDSVIRMFNGELSASLSRLLQ